MKIRSMVAAAAVTLSASTGSAFAQGAPQPLIDAAQAVGSAFAQGVPQAEASDPDASSPSQRHDQGARLVARGRTSAEMDRNN